MKKHQEPTKVKLVYDALVAMDDFMSCRQLHMLLAPNVTMHQVLSSLHMLKHYTAVDAVEAGGRLWWFATPGSDTRTKLVPMRKPEDRPRRSRAKRS